jgi:hypothetical protein
MAMMIKTNWRDVDYHISECGRCAPLMDSRLDGASLDALDDAISSIHGTTTAVSA